MNSGDLSAHALGGSFKSFSDSFRLRFLGGGRRFGCFLLLAILLEGAVKLSPLLVRRGRKRTERDEKWKEEGGWGRRTTGRRMPSSRLRHSSRDGSRANWKFRYPPPLLQWQPIEIRKGRIPPPSLHPSRNFPLLRVSHLLATSDSARASRVRLTVRVSPLNERECKVVLKLRISNQ